jgi:hypothetical protein
MFCRSVFFLLSFFFWPVYFYHSIFYMRILHDVKSCNKIKCLSLEVLFVLYVILVPVVRPYALVNMVYYIYSGRRGRDRMVVLYHIMLYTSPWSIFQLRTCVVIGTDSIGSCKSNYHTITATTTAVYVINHIDQCIWTDNLLFKMYFYYSVENSKKIFFIWEFYMMWNHVIK